MKRFGMMCLVLMAATVLAVGSVTAGALDEIQKRGTLRVGMEPGYMPFELTNQKGEIIGFDVDIGPLFQTPQEAAKMAIENDVHVVGASSLTAGHKTLVPGLVEELKKQGGEDIKVVAGGIIPPKDYDYLYDRGVQAVFGPGTSVIDSANRTLDLIEAAA